MNAQLSPGRLALGAGFLVVATSLIIWFWPGDKTPVHHGSLKVGVEASLLSAAVFVAADRGFFAEAGVDVQLREFPSGRAAFNEMLDTQSVDVSTVAPTPIMFASFRRQDFAVLATFVHSYEDVKVLVRSDRGVRGPEDLKGKKIGTPAGTTGQFFLAAYLARHRMTSAQVEAVDIRPADLPQALADGRVDGIVVWEPHASNARKAVGDDKILRLPSSDIYRETFNFMVMNEFAERSPDKLAAFLQAVDRATDYIRDNKEESQAIVARRLKAEPAELAALWDEFEFGIALDHSLVLTLEAEGEWAIENDLVDKKELPNYLNFVRSGPLHQVKPDAVRLIQ